MVCRLETGVQLRLHVCFVLSCFCLSDLAVVRIALRALHTLGRQSTPEQHHLFCLRHVILPCPARGGSSVQTTDLLYSLLNKIQERIPRILIKSYGSRVMTGSQDGKAAILDTHLPVGYCTSSLERGYAGLHHFFSRQLSVPAVGAGSLHHRAVWILAPKPYMT